MHCKLKLWVCISSRSRYIDFNACSRSPTNFSIKRKKQFRPHFIPFNRLFLFMHLASFFSFSSSNNSLLFSELPFGLSVCVHWISHAGFFETIRKNKICFSVTTYNRPKYGNKKSNERCADKKCRIELVCINIEHFIQNLWTLFAIPQIYVLRNRFFVVYKQKAHVKLRNRW